MPKAIAQSNAGKPDLPSRSGQGAETRARIRAATADLVGERGWDRVTTRSIAQRAGVNQALVHYHFGSVEQLLRQAVMSAMQRDVVELTERLLASGSPGEGIRQLSDWLSAFTPTSPMAVLSAEILARATRDPAIRDWMAQWLAEVREDIARSIEAGQEEGRLRTDVPADGVAVLTAALIDGLVFHGLVDPRLDIAGVAQTLDIMLTVDQEKERN
jgi:AcrR family transcriptional regulator